MRFVVLHVVHRVRRDISSPSQRSVSHIARVLLYRVLMRVLIF